MEGITQATLGAVAAQACFGRKLPRTAWLLGVAGGLLPDIDVLFKGLAAADDPLGGLLTHRHFTHSLIMIPVLALITVLPFIFWRTYRGKRWAVYGAAFVGVATHAPLDACTNYGTLLYWPFSDTRVSWDFISFIDPFFTVPLLLLVLTAMVMRKVGPARVAAIYAFVYLSLGAYQHHRAMTVQQSVITMRGHHFERGKAVPLLLSNQLWSSVYIADGRIHADVIRLPLFGEPEVDVGNSVMLATLDDLRDAGVTDPDIILAFEGFYWFADGFTAFHPTNRRYITDMRFCIDPDSMDTLWGIDLGDVSASNGKRFVFLARGLRSDLFAKLWDAIQGNAPGFITLGNLKATPSP